MEIIFKLEESGALGFDFSKELTELANQMKTVN